MFTLEFKAEVPVHKKAENLSPTGCGRKFDVLPKLVPQGKTIRSGQIDAGRQPSRSEFRTGRESFWHSMKVAEKHGRDFATRLEARHCAFGCIEGWYNMTRLPSSKSL